MKVLFFGSYDKARHPRIQILIEGLRAHGDEVFECNIPLGDDTEQRLQAVRQPWRLLPFGFRLLSTWHELRKASRDVPAPDLVVVGYMGHFDIHLARRIWPRTPIALDHLIFAADTARDRRVTGGIKLRLLERLDEAAIARADIPFVDTEEHLGLLSPADRRRACVVPVGAPESWFQSPQPHERERMRVLFFGLFTPLQGTEVIGRAIAALRGAPIDFTMVGKGQDYVEARRHALANPNVTWIEWLDGADLRVLAANHDVCLGIFGNTPKALRVVPNKVFQGAAAGCAVLTSDTAPQRTALGGAGMYVTPGNASEIAQALRRLARDRQQLWEARWAAYTRARDAFTPKRVVAPLKAHFEATGLGAHVQGSGE